LNLCQEFLAIIKIDGVKVCIYDVNWCTYLLLHAQQDALTHNKDEPYLKPLKKEGRDGVIRWRGKKRSLLQRRHKLLQRLPNTQPGGSRRRWIRWFEPRSCHRTHTWCERQPLLRSFKYLQDASSTYSNSVALVRERTIPTKLPPLAGEVSVNFCGWRVSHGQRDGSLRPYSRFSRPEPLLFLPSSSSVIFTRLSGPGSRPTTSQKIL
jgi:hypothetical protein